jgi:hypothetical protein
MYFAAPRIRIGEIPTWLTIIKDGLPNPAKLPAMAGLE